MKAIQYLNLSQFFGALNDYIFRFLVQFYLIDKFVPKFYSNPEIASFIAILFIVPFLILTPVSGIFADRFKKEKSIIFIKILEVLIAVIGFLGFYFDNVLTVLISLVGLASHSAIFSPIKYGIISELVKKEELTKANGVIEALTYIAIVVGPFMAAILNQNFDYDISSSFCLILAFLGLLTAIKIKNENHYISRNPFSVFFLTKPFVTIFQIRKDSYLLAAILGSILFFFVAGFAQLNLLPYGMEVFKLSKESAANLFTFGAIGIALGSYLAGILSKRLIEFGIVPIGMLLVSISSIAIGLIPTSLVKLSIWITVFGIGSGIFLVPLFTFIQYQSPVKLKSNLLAANTFFSLLSVALSILLTGVIIKFGFTIANGFVLLGVITMIIHLITLIILPDFLIRFIGVTILKLIYRIKIKNDDLIPREGGALLIPNHVSYVDALILSVCIQRRIRFIMWDEIYYSNKLITLICDTMKVIPISLKSRADSESALVQARKALEDGWLVCIFAEGGLTRNGILSHFKSGFENILKDSNYPIIPVYLSGLWNSYFSLNRKKSLKRNIFDLPYVVNVYFGELLNANSSSRIVYQKVKNLEYQAIVDQDTELDFPSSAISDKITLNKKEIINKASYLSDEIENKSTGILLSPSSESLIANIAVAIKNQSAFNINYTFTIEQIQNLIERTKITQIISNHTFYKKFETLKNITWILPEFINEKKLNFKLKGKSILATSGSSGQPKIVTHELEKIIKNAKALYDVFLPDKDDKILSALPHFHSFGLTSSVWLPIVSGVNIYYCSNPLSAKTIVNQIVENKITHLITTPSFLRLYLKEDLTKFNSLKLIITGGEPLNIKLREAVTEMGIKIVEGYGMTELAPVVAINAPYSKDTALTPLPGVSIRTKSIESEEIIYGELGRLEVKSAYLMDEYNNIPVNYKWFATGDLATIDKYNNLTVNGRLSRFSKIAGEMVSHESIENIFNNVNLHVVVTGKPCDKYGEKLVLYFDKNLISLEQILDKFKNSEIPNLWKIKQENIIEVSEIPLLGTGKPNLEKLKEI